MSTAKVKTRQVGALASLPKGGKVDILSETGGTLTVATRPSEPGFGPLDLLYASLSACLALSTRIAASELGLLDRLEAVRVHVTGDKAEDGPARVERFHVVFEIDGDLDAEARHKLIEAAEGGICTISNTLQGSPLFHTRDATAEAGAPA